MEHYAYAEIRQLVGNAFPEIASEFQESYESALRALARHVQQAKGRSDWLLYKRALQFIDDLLERPDAPLRNALSVEFLEHIDFSGPRGPEAWALLSPRTQRAWQHITEYNTRFSKPPTRQGKKR